VVMRKRFMRSAYREQAERSLTRARSASSETILIICKLNVTPGSGSLQRLIRSSPFVVQCDAHQAKLRQRRRRAKQCEPCRSKAVCPLPWSRSRSTPSVVRGHSHAWSIGPERDPANHWAFQSCVLTVSPNEKKLSDRW